MSRRIEEAAAAAAQTPLNVDEEYNEALRTKSYADIWAKFHHQLKKSSISSAPSTPITPTTTQTQQVELNQEYDQEKTTSGPHSHHSSGPLPSRYYSYLPDFLLEPSQESLLAATSNDSYTSHHLYLQTALTDFFDITFQACTACASLLASIDSTRSHHRSIRRLLLSLSSATPNHSSTSTLFSQLSSQLDLDNPLSPKNLSHFHLIHARYGPLIRLLTTTHRKILRRVKFVRGTRKASRFVVIAAIGAVAVVAVALAAHAVVAVAAAPVVAAAGAPKAAVRWVRRKVGSVKLESLERARSRVDAAAKGAYIVGRDMDTMSRMVRRLHDEVEHGRDVARMVLRNRERQLVKEVVREMEDGELGFEEQLEELEEHVFLCLLTINRSRRLVAREMMMMAEANSEGTKDRA